MNKIFKKILTVALLAISSMQLQAQNRLWAWGGNSFGQLGNGNYRDTLVPIIVNPGTTDPKWVYFSAETTTTLGIKADGSLWAWGSGTQAQLGNGGTGTSNSVNAPLLIDNGTGVHGKWLQVDEGGTHSLGVREDGSLWAWGSGTNGKLGNNAETDLLVPTLIDAGSGTHGKWAFVEAGLSHSTALRQDSTLWEWGYNAYGQIGINTETPLKVLVPMMVDSGVAVHGKFILISNTAHHNVGIRQDGSLWAWGWNAYYQVGNSSQVDMDSIKMIDPGTGPNGKWTYASAGYYHNVALRADSTLWGWGRNNRGQLANANLTSMVQYPQQIDAGKWLIAEAGQNHSLGIKPDKTFWAWGYNANGQLGDGTIVQRTAPTAITALNNLVNPVVKAGINYSMVLEFADQATPVKLGWFNAVKKNNQALLTWQTATEANNKGFYVEQSANATNWKELGFIVGNNNSTVSHTYDFTDKLPLKGINYYRLKQTDFDGKITYSDLRSLNFTVAGNVSVWPNPTANTLNISAGKKIKVLSIINAAGQVMQVQPMQAQQGNYNINISNYSKGVYVLNILYEDGGSISNKFLKN